VVNRIEKQCLNRQANDIYHYLNHVIYIYGSSHVQSLMHLAGHPMKIQ